MEYKVFQMTNIDEKSVVIKSDAFICFNSQEERAFNALLTLHQKDLIQDALVLSFPITSSEENISLALSSDFMLTVHEVENDLDCNIIPCLKAVNGYISGRSNISIDISCMPIPYLAQLLHFLIEKHSAVTIKIYYTEPFHYTLQNLFDYSSYSGEIDFRAIRGFEGETSQANEVKRVLFYLMGFEMKHIYSRIQQDVAPDEIAPINGFPSFYPKYKDISLINDGNNFYESDIEVVFAESNNPFEVYNALIELENKYHDYRIDVIPVCTKPMALGACMFALKNNNSRCRIVFPFPSEYLSQKSRGKGKLWEYCIQ